MRLFSLDANKVNFVPLTYLFLPRPPEDFHDAFCVAGVHLDASGGKGVTEFAGLETEEFANERTMVDENWRILVRHFPVLSFSRKFGVRAQYAATAPHRNCTRLVPIFG